MRFALVAIPIVLFAAAVGPGVAPAASNEPPLAEAGLDQTVVLGDTVLLDGGGSTDPDGNVTAYRWTITTPNGSTIAPACPTCERTSFVANQVGTYEVTLTVFDDDEASSSDTMYVTVEGTGGPAATLSGPERATTGDTPRFRASLDAGGAGLAEAIWRVDGAVVGREGLSGRHAEPELRTSFEDAGPHEVSVTVVDEGGKRATARETIEIDDPGGPGSPPPERTGRVTGVGATGEPAVTISGPDEVEAGSVETFRYTATTPGSYVVNANWENARRTLFGDQSKAAHTFTEAPGSTVEISVTIETSDGRTATDTKTVEIEEDVEPAVTIGRTPSESPIEVTNGTTVNFEATGFHFDAGIDHFEWSLPDGGSFENTHWRWAGVRVPAQNRSYTVEVRAVGNGGETATATTTFTVVENESERPSGDAKTPNGSVQSFVALDSHDREISTHDARTQGGLGLPEHEETVRFEASALVENAEKVTFEFHSADAHTHRRTMSIDGDSEVVSVTEELVFPVREKLAKSGTGFGDADYSATVTLIVKADGKKVASDTTSITWVNKREDKLEFGIGITPSRNKIGVGESTKFRVTVSSKYDGNVQVNFGDGTTQTLSFDVGADIIDTTWDKEDIKQTKGVWKTYESAGRYSITAVPQERTDRGTSSSTRITVQEEEDATQSTEEKRFNQRKHRNNPVSGDPENPGDENGETNPDDEVFPGRGNPRADIPNRSPPVSDFDDTGEDEDADEGTTDPSTGGSTNGGGDEFGVL